MPWISRKNEAFLHCHRLVGSPNCARGEGWSALQMDKAAWGSAVFLDITDKNRGLISD